MNERPSKDGNPIPPYYAPITERYTYVEYGTGEKEFYDRVHDSYKMTSRYNDDAYTGAVAALSDRLPALKNYTGRGCRVAEDVR